MTIVNPEGKPVQQTSAHGKLYEKLKESPDDRAFRIDRHILESAVLDMLNTARLLQLAMVRLQAMDQQLKTDGEQPDKPEEPSS